MRLIILASLLLFQTSVFAEELTKYENACHDFESCIKAGEDGFDDNYSVTRECYLKAIAFKLDEISKKLDYSDEERSSIRQEKVTFDNDTMDKQNGFDMRLICSNKDPNRIDNGNNYSSTHGNRTLIVPKKYQDCLDAGTPYEECVKPYLAQTNK